MRGITVYTFVLIGGRARGRRLVSRRAFELKRYLLFGQCNVVEVNEIVNEIFVDIFPNMVSSFCTGMVFRQH